MSQKNITLVLGDQLYKHHPALDLDTDFVMIESKDFNTVYKYHKTRINHCFVAMREYADYIRSKDKAIHYFTIDMQQEIKTMFDEIINKGYTDLHIAEIDNKGVKRDIIDLCLDGNLKLHWLPSPKFLTSTQNWLDYKARYPKSLKMNEFYIMQRNKKATHIIYWSF